MDIFSPDEAELHQKENPETDCCVVEIPVYNTTQFNNEFEKLVKRAQKLGVEPPNLRHLGTFRNKNEKVLYNKFLIINPIVKLPGGFAIVACIMHEEDKEGRNSNQVFFPRLALLQKEEEKEVQQRLLNEVRPHEMSPQCSHCKTKRKRKKTFILYSEESNSFKQIASTCLRDFTGHDGQKIFAFLEQVRSFVAKEKDYDDEMPFGSVDRRFYLKSISIYCKRELLFAFAIEVIQKIGYKSKKQVEFEGGNSTAYEIEEAYFSLFIEKDEEEAKQQKETLVRKHNNLIQDIILSYKQEQGEEEEFNNFLLNCKSLVRRDLLELSQSGMIAAMVNSYLKQKKKEEEQLAENVITEFFGNIGEKYKNVHVKCIFVSEPKYSHHDFYHSKSYRIVKFKVLNDNDINTITQILTCFYGGKSEFSADTKYHLSFRVKNFNTFKDKKETVINYLRLSKNKK
jgi:hypothetical protein